ncbi:MAG: hypothetical protein INR73_01855 [Williamsia sp.]|nr:hypothetical protein [Williamsia sp.]
MENRTFDVAGRVVEAKTGTALPNLRVEAWDKDIKYNDLLGDAFTNDDGGFVIQFDVTYFREYAPDTSPDLFFKVYRGKQLLKSTEDAVILNARSREQITIRIDLPDMRPVGKDRISATQVLKAANFFQQSDFRGVYNEFRSKAGTSLGFVSDMVVNTLTKFDLKPVQVSTSRNRDIIGKDVETVRRNLQAQNIEVQEVLAYNPTLNRASLSELGSFPVNLRAGEKINLYEVDGQIRYYAIVKDKQASLNEAVDTAEVQPERLQKLEEELTAARQHAAEKDEQLSKLQQEIESLRREHDEIKNLLNSDAITQLLKNVQQPKKNKDNQQKPES